MKIGVMGAGSIGCFIGGRLAARGHDVVFVGRERIRQELREHGLSLRDCDGRSSRIPGNGIAFETDERALAGGEVVLFCLKSLQTESAATRLVDVLPAGTLVVSMQNGMRNAETLRSRLKNQTVLGGIVGFNVRSGGLGDFRRTTSGALFIEASSAPQLTELAGALRSSGFETRLPRDIRALQWTKLVMNLNNAVSALSDRPTRELLASRGYRRILAALISEALKVMQDAGIKPARLGALPVGIFPLILRLPTPLLKAIARAQLKIDPHARSSMWEDLARGRKTEVDFLNGEIVRIAEGNGGSAPLNRAIMRLVHEAEERGRGSPALTADELWRRLA